MFRCPDNYEDYLKKQQEWSQKNAAETRAYILKTYPVLCNFFNLPVDFKEEELEKAYREIRLKNHPDRPNGDAEKFMKAFEIYKELKSMYECYKRITQPHDESTFCLSELFRRL